MSTREEIKAALEQEGPLTCTELAKHCPACEEDRQIVARNIAELRSQGYVKAIGLEGGEPLYDIDQWPDDESAPERVAVAAKDGNAVELPQAAEASAATTPARVAVQQETSMKEKQPIKQRIQDALKAQGKCNLDKLAKIVGTTKATLYTMMGKMRDEKLVRPVPGERGVYELGAQPAPPQPDAKPKVEKAASRAPVARKPAAPSVPSAPANGSAQFAINEQGELGIELGESKIRLAPGCFARLRAFIERTQPVWEVAK